MRLVLVADLAAAGASSRLGGSFSTSQGAPQRGQKRASTVVGLLQARQIATVVTFLVWIYASSVIFLFGVEFSAAWVRLQGVSRARLYS